MSGDTSSQEEHRPLRKSARPSGGPTESSTDAGRGQRRHRLGRHGSLGAASTAGVTACFLRVKSVQGQAEGPRSEGRTPPCRAPHLPLLPFLSRPVRIPDRTKRESTATAREGHHGRVGVCSPLGDRGNGPVTGPDRELLPLPHTSLREGRNRPHDTAEPTRPVASLACSFLETQSSPDCL